MFDTDGKAIIGLVSVGTTVVRLNAGDVSVRSPRLLVTGGALAAAAGGTALVSQRLRRQTRGLDPSEMTRMYEHHDAVLHAVREGVLITGGDGRLLLANDEARRLLDLPADAEGRVSPIWAWSRTAKLLVSGRTATDKVHLAGDGLLAVNCGRSTPTAARRAAWPPCATPPNCAPWRAGRRWPGSGCGYCTKRGCRSVPRWMWSTPPRSWPRWRPPFADVTTVDLREPVLRGEEPTGPDPGMRRAAVHGIEGAQSLYPVGESIRFIPNHPVGASAPSAAMPSSLPTWPPPAAGGPRTPNAPGASWTTASIP